MFDDLLKRPAFRSDLLYFIRLAGNYAANIFADMRNRAPSEKRKEFRDWLTNYQPINNRYETEKPKLLDNRLWFDALKYDFPEIIRKMPDYMRNRLSNAVQHDHVLPLDLANFCKALDDLIDYRGWLGYSKERIKKGEARPKVSDTRLLKILALFLIPHLSNHLAGRVHHHARRIGMRHQECQALVGEVHKINEDGIARRREASKYINGLKRRTDNESVKVRITQKYGNVPSDQAVHRIAKAENTKLKNLENRKAALVELYRQYCDESTWPRHNYEKFLIRFGFIGKARIKALENLLGCNNAQKPDFIHAIEAAFNLSIDIALIIHCWLNGLEERGVPIRTQKAMRKIDGAEFVGAIRNEIAHGGWVWKVTPNNGQEPLTFKEVLATLCAVLNHPNIYDKKQMQNDLLTQLEARLHKEKRDFVYKQEEAEEDPNRRSPPIVVKRWTNERREKYKNREIWRIEKRPLVKALAANWMHDIKAFKENI